MRVNHLLSAILKGPFAVEHQTVMGYLPRVAQLLNGEGLAEGGTPTAPPEASVLYAMMNPEGVGKTNLAAANPKVAVRRRNKSYDDAQPGSVAVVEIKGVMMKADQWGLCEDTAGTASLGRQLQEADQHENIAAIVLDIDSGGGAVDGMIEFNSLIAGLSKPVVVYSDGMIASAAYSAASGADLIVLNNVSCSVGSIGVMASLVDYQPVLEKMGVNFHTLRATGSERKNEDFYQLLAGNHKPYIANVLTPLKEMMHAAVRSGRGKKLKDTALLGDMFFADAAIANGLADEKGNFSYAVNRALELANAPDTGEAVEEEVATDPGNPEELDTLHDDDENDLDEDPNATTLPPNTMFGKNKFTAVAALAGLEGAAVTQALVDAANDELEAQGIKGAALISGTAYDQLSAKGETTKDGKCASCGQDMPKEGKAGAQEQLVAMQNVMTAAGVTDLAALVAERNDWKTKAEAFGSQSGAMGTTATKMTGDVSEGTAATEAQKAIDELPHNVALDNNPLFAGKVQG